MISEAIYPPDALYDKVSCPLKRQSLYGLFTTVVFTVILMLGMSSARADLIDLSNPESVIEYAISDANWLIKPDFSIDRRCLDRLEEGSELDVLLTFLIDEQGKITQVKIIKSSGDTCIDRTVVRQAVTGRLKPWTLKGKTIKGRAILPLKFVIMK